MSKYAWIPWAGRFVAYNPAAVLIVSAIMLYQASQKVKSPHFVVVSRGLYTIGGGLAYTRVLRTWLSTYGDTALGRAALRYTITTTIATHRYHYNDVSNHLDIYAFNASLHVRYAIASPIPPIGGPHFKFLTSRCAYEKMRIGTVYYNYGPIFGAL